jgi:hypothetical protein
VPAAASPTAAFAPPAPALKRPVLGTLSVILGGTAALFSVVGCLIYLIVWWNMDVPNKIAIVGGLESPGAGKLVLPKVLNYLGLAAGVVACLLGVISLVFEGKNKPAVIGLSVASASLVFLLAFWTWTTSRTTESYFKAWEDEQREKFKNVPPGKVKEREDPF